MAACVVCRIHADFRSSLNASSVCHIHDIDIIDVHALARAYRYLHRSTPARVDYTIVHALVSLAASATWPDKKREPNRRQTDRALSIDID